MMENRMAVYSNKEGFTLIEFLVAIVILMVGLLGLLQTINYALSYNLQNQLRNEAVLVADSQLSREMAKGFDNVSTSTKSMSVSWPVLTGFKNFSVTRTGTTLQNTKQVNFEIRWRHKNTSYNHGASTFITRTNQ
jgi:type IV pilus assembly protein PilV